MPHCPGCSKKFPNLEEKVLCGRCCKLDQNPSEPEKKNILANPQYKADKRPHLSEDIGDLAEFLTQRTLDFEETASKYRLHKPLPPNDSLLKGYEIIPGKNKPVQISLPMQKEPFDVQDDANEVIDKILSNGKSYYDHYSNRDIKFIWDRERVIFVVVNGTNLQDHNFVDVDVIKLGGKIKDIKKNDLTLQLQLHEDVPIISDEELNASGRMDDNKKITRAYGIRSLGAKCKNPSSKKVHMLAAMQL
ncbi:hypothetical protein BU17DRAFT_72030 [Hysterangium stoloniferum]|nr:hypothetical protein BU17DRAFT_72030 [Hysterangium stoloniferum]